VNPAPMADKTAEYWGNVGAVAASDGAVARPALSESIVVGFAISAMLASSVDGLRLGQLHPHEQAAASGAE